MLSRKQVLVPLQAHLNINNFSETTKNEDEYITNGYPIKMQV